MLTLQVTIIIVTLLSQTAVGQRECDARRPCSASGKRCCKYTAWVDVLTCNHLFSIATQIHEGDITILVSQNGAVLENKNGKASRVERGATSIRGLLWANATVPYTINNSFSGERLKKKNPQNYNSQLLSRDIHFLVQRMTEGSFLKQWATGKMLLASGFVLEPIRGTTWTFPQGVAGK